MKLLVHPIFKLGNDKCCSCNDALRSRVWYQWRAAGINLFLNFKILEEIENSDKILVYLDKDYIRVLDDSIENEN